MISVKGFKTVVLALLLALSKPIFCVANCESRVRLEIESEEKEAFAENCIFEIGAHISRLSSFERQGFGLSGNEMVRYNKVLTALKQQVVIFMRKSFDVLSVRAFETHSVYWSLSNELIRSMASILEGEISFSSASSIGHQKRIIEGIYQLISRVALSIERFKGRLPLAFQGWLNGRFVLWEKRLSIARSITGRQRDIFSRTKVVFSNSEAKCPVCIEETLDVGNYMLSSVCNHNICRDCFVELAEHHEYSPLPCPICRKQLWSNGPVGLLIPRAPSWTYASAVLLFSEIPILIL